MAFVRKRTWVSGGETKTSWLVGYRDHDRRRRFETFKTKKDADARRVEIEHELSQGTHSPKATSITVAEAAKLWLEHGEVEGLEPTTLRGYRQHVDLHINPLVGHMKLAQLTKPGIENLRDQLVKTRSSRIMARKILTSLKSIIGEAQRRGLVAQNVASGVKVSVNDRDEDQLEVGHGIPSKSEVSAIIGAATGRWRPLLVTAISTGMRASELRGLRWSDVDFDQKVVVHVRQRADQFNSIGWPKSKAGRRTIPMSPLVVNTLKEWKLACPKGRLDLVFPNGAGKVEALANIMTRGFRPIQVKAGVVDADGKPKYGMHALRHFAASCWIEQGFTPKRLQALLGHASIQMSYDIYGHLFPSLEDDHSKFAAVALSIVNAK